MPKRLLVHFPWSRRREHLDFLLDRGLQPEIAFTGEDLDSLDPREIGTMGARLAAAGHRATVHAPFHDLNPGALEPLVAEVSARRLSQTLNAAAEIGAELVVVHPGYEKWKYGLNSRLWLEASLNFWPPLLKRAEELQVRIALENIFEESPETLIQLGDAIDSPVFGFCFDVGHWHLFSGTDLPGWLAALGPRLRHLHLHDNRGDRDAHLAIGEGTIDFPLLFSEILSLPTATTMTLEAHDRETLLRSLSRVLPLLTA